MRVTHEKKQSQLKLKMVLNRYIRTYNMGVVTLAPQPRVCCFCCPAVVTIVILQLLPRLDVSGSYQTEAGAVWEGDRLCDHIGLFAAVVHQTPHPSIFLCRINTTTISTQRNIMDMGNMLGSAASSPPF